MLILGIVLTIMFALAGGVKVFGNQAQKDQFDEFGYSDSLMRLVGIAEIVGAVGLQIKGMHLFAAIGLLVIMLGAIMSHQRAGHESKKSLPATILAIALGVYIGLDLLG